MRTNIEIDDTLMAATLKATGLKTKREALEQGLRTLLRLRQQTELAQTGGLEVDALSEVARAVRDTP